MLRVGRLGEGPRDTLSGGEHAEGVQENSLLRAGPSTELPLRLGKNTVEIFSL